MYLTTSSIMYQFEFLLQCSQWINIPLSFCLYPIWTTNIENLQHWFQDRLVGMVSNSVGCIMQNILELKPHFLVHKTCRPIIFTIKMINLFLFRRIDPLFVQLFLVCCFVDIFIFDEKFSMFNYIQIFFNRVSEEFCHYHNISLKWIYHK